MPTIVFVVAKVIAVMFFNSVFYLFIYLFLFAVVVVFCPVFKRGDILVNTSLIEAI